MFDHASEVTPVLDPEVVNGLHSSVVAISTQSATGSGVVVGSNGSTTLIITNAHVVQNASVVGVSFQPGTSLPDERRAVVVARAGDLDLALVELDLGHPWPALALAPYASLPRRSALYAAGFPWGRSGELADGVFPSVTITSGFNVPPRQTNLTGEEVFFCGVNPGNSSGAAVDADGRLRGIVTAYLPTTEASILIPAEHVRAFIERVHPRASLTWDPVEPRVTPFTQPVKRRPAHAPSLVAVRTPFGIAVGAVVSVGTDHLLIATADWLVGREAGGVPVEVSSWKDGVLQGTHWAEVVLSDSDEGLALLRTGRIPGVEALMVSAQPPDLQETEPVTADMLRWTGRTAARRGTVSAVWRGAESVELFKVDLGIQPLDLGGLVFDASERLIGLSVVSVEFTNVTTLIPAHRLAALTQGHLRAGWATVNFDGTSCSIGATFQVTDPLGTLEEVGLSVARGQLYQPDWRAAVPQYGYPVARGAIAGDLVRLRAVVTPCARGKLSLQPYVLGNGHVERSPVYAVDVGPTPGELLIRGVYFAGARDAVVPHTEPARLPPSPCASGDWPGCLAQCETSAGDACFDFGRHILEVRGAALETRDVAVALAHFTRACRAGRVPLACAALAELNPSVPNPTLVPEAQRRCDAGSLMDCLLVLESGATAPRVTGSLGAYEQLCNAGVGAACVRHALNGANPSPGFSLRLGCDALDAQACLRLSLSATASPMGRLEGARTACELGLRMGCQALAWLSSKGLPQHLDPALAAASWATACAGSRCIRLEELRETDLVPGPVTTLDPVLVERVHRLAPPVAAPLAAAAGSSADELPGTWDVERLDMADIGAVQFSLAAPQSVGAQGLLALQQASELVTRCVLVRLSYDDQWMKRPRGFGAEVVIDAGPSGAKARSAPWKDPKVARCLQPMLGVLAPAQPTTLRMRVIKG